LATESWGVPFSILSAKHGLLHPDETIDPYDVALKGQPKSFKSEWARRVAAQLCLTFDSKKQFIVLAGDDYYLPLAHAMHDSDPRFLLPMVGLSLGHRLTFLNNCIKLRKRRLAVERAYGMFDLIRSQLGLHELKTLMNADLPKQGVYFFFDDHEVTQFSKTIPRLVRIGTHGVSAGSVATLRNRLRTHFGTRAGQGNHRASIFRLHVGRAMAVRDQLQESFPNWGKGQSAPKEITQHEMTLEARVSDYIGRLRVLYIPVADAAGTASMRATIERQFIALFTENLCPVETPSPNWLGRYSDKELIRETGLWNVRDVGSEYDLRFIPFFETIVAKAFSA